MASDEKVTAALADFAKAVMRGANKALGKSDLLSREEEDARRQRLHDLSKGAEALAASPSFRASEIDRDAGLLLAPLCHAKPAAVGALAAGVRAEPRARALRAIWRAAMSAGARRSGRRAIRVEDRA